MFSNISDGKSKVLATILLLVILVGLAILENFEYIGEDSWFWWFILAESVLEIVFPDSSGFAKEHNTKKYYYKTHLLGENMFEQTFDLVLGKEVKIKTLDEVISGVVKSTEGDFLIVEKNKKNSVETVYVNKNAVQTVKTIKLK